MAEAGAGTGDPVIDPLDEGLPGGYESIAKMYADNQKFKQEAIDNKARKSSNTALQSKIDAYETAEADRIKSEQSELEQAQTEIVALKSKAVDDAAAITKAEMAILFERELSGRLAGLDDPSQKLMRMHYQAAVKTSDGYSDEETLKLILDPIDELLKGMKTADGTAVIMSGANQLVSGQTSQSREAAIAFLKLPFKEQMKVLRGKKG